MTARQGSVAVWEIIPPMDVDIEALARLMLVAWGRQPTTDEVSTKALSIRAELNTLNPARRAVLVAGDPGSPAGWCKTWRDEIDEKTWWFAGLVVDPLRRRQGVATALARSVEFYARDHGAEVLRSQTHADNWAAVQFHEAVGFVNDGQMDAADGDKLINFHRPLA